MNRLPLHKRTQLLHLLCEGSSLRAAGRVAHAAFNTVLKLQVDAGKACDLFHDQRVHSLNPSLIQCDELWAFCYAKKGHVESAKAPPPEAGDVWTWVAIDSKTKLVISWWCGARGHEDAVIFLEDLHWRLAAPESVEVVTDGLEAYQTAWEQVFGIDGTHYILNKSKGKNEGVPRTAYVERQNLNIRMGNRRFTRLTNAHSKKLRNHYLSLALYFTYYNWVRTHMSLDPLTTPAMAAGLAKLPLSLEEIDALISN